MKKILLQELKQLPQTNQLGYSNESDRQRLQSWIVDLTRIEHSGAINDQESEIGLWFKDDCWNYLCDYDMMVEEFKEYEEILRLTAQFKV
ncbi:MAG: hypothetical protein JXR80_02395 [Deltaproteobacteria bacterium]|nr:hypothetical protein [Deltaproteobacteria bacterium]